MATDACTNEGVAVKVEVMDSQTDKEAKMELEHLQAGANPFFAPCTVDCVEDQPATLTQPYVCGGCWSSFDATCQLHAHIQEHGLGGSYHYDHRHRIAYPKYDSVCRETQTAVTIGTCDSKSSRNISQKRPCAVLFNHNKRIVAADFERAQSEMINNKIDIDKTDKNDVDSKLHQRQVEKPSQKKVPKTTRQNKYRVILVKQVKKPIKSTSAFDIASSFTGNDKAEDYTSSTSKVHSLKNQGTSENEDSFPEGNCSTVKTENLALLPDTDSESRNMIVSNETKASADEEKLLNKEQPRIYGRFAKISKLRKQNIRPIKKEGKFASRSIQPEDNIDTQNTDQSEPTTGGTRKPEQKSSVKADEINSSLPTSAFTQDVTSDLQTEHERECGKSAKARQKLSTEQIITGESLPNLKAQNETEFGNLKSEAWICKVCNKKFSLERNLYNHLSKNHNYKCDHCGRVFKRYKNLWTHLNEQNCLALPNRRRNFPCELCDAKFYNRGGLKNHLRCVHSDIRRFVCEICGAQFKTSSVLKVHYMSHNKDDQKYKCEICNSNFTQAGALKRHKKCHSGEADFNCEHCGKQFHRKENLTTHLRQHTGNKPYKCDYCTQAFTFNVSRKAHMKKCLGRNASILADNDA